MNDKELNLDALENADEETIKIIAADCPASDEEKERMFAMSRKIYKERTKESEYKNEVEVSGVDVYKRPVWLKFAAAAAAVAIAAGAITGGSILLKRHRTPHIVESSEPSAFAMSPFGDLSSCKVRLSNAGIAPAVFEPREEKRKALLTALNEGDWNKISPDTPLPDGETELIYLKDGDRKFLLTLYGDHTIAYSDSDTQNDARYEIDLDTENAVREAIKYDPEAGDKLIYSTMYLYDPINSVWDEEVPEDPSAVDVFFPITQEHLSVSAKNCYYCYGKEWDPEAAVSCERIPGLVWYFGETDWKEADSQPNLIADDNTIHFRCTDNDALVTYYYTLYPSGYVNVRSENVEKSEKQSCLYKLDDFNINMIETGFRNEIRGATSSMTPDMALRYDPAISALLSRNDDPSKLTDVNEEDMKSIVKAIKAHPWESLPDDAECGKPVSRLTVTARLNIYDYMFEFYDNNVVYEMSSSKKYSVSPDLIGTLRSISDRVWGEEAVPAEKPTEKAADNETTDNETTDNGDSSDDAEILERARALYKDAIVRYKEYTEAGVPPGMEMDWGNAPNEWIGNMIYYVLPGVSSKDEIVEMFLSEFSERYHANDLDGDFPYLERDGKVYTTSANKGNNISYRDTELTEIKRKTDDEIFFTVINYYGDNGIDTSAPWTEQTEFSVVIQPDGSWKVGKLTIPY
jgi:hypothetical protein